MGSRGAVMTAPAFGREIHLDPMVVSGGKTLKFTPHPRAGVLGERPDEQ